MLHLSNSEALAARVPLFDLDEAYEGSNALESTFT